MVAAIRLAGFSSLREDSYPRPVGVAAWMPAPFHDRGLTDAMQVKEYLDMREVGEARKRIGGKFALIQQNLGDDATPVVFARPVLRRVNPADWIQDNLHVRHASANGGSMASSTIVGDPGCEPSIG